MKFIHKEIITEEYIIGVLDKEGLDGWEAIYISEYHGTRPYGLLSQNPSTSGRTERYTSTRIIFKKAIKNDGLNYGQYLEQKNNP